MRNWRRNLPEPNRQQAAALLAQSVAATSVFRNARRVAAYIAFDGEIDPAALIELAFESGKEVFLPVVDNTARMRFARYTPDTSMTLNKYGIPEPSADRRSFVSAKTLDLAVVPLVAFDLDGNRLGMGAGYYDRCFAYLRLRRHWHRPRLLGVAYEFQQVERLQPESWDIPLHGVATEHGQYLLRRR